jgi:hypothetical protein
MKGTTTIVLSNPPLDGLHALKQPGMASNASIPTMTRRASRNACWRSSKTAFCDHRMSRSRIIGCRGLGAARVAVGGVASLWG